MELIIDNIIYASQLQALNGEIGITNPPAIPPITANISRFNQPFDYTEYTPQFDNPVYRYTNPQRFNFMANIDNVVLQTAVQRHWFDIDATTTYQWPGSTELENPIILSNFSPFVPYHLIYAYLIENTKIIEVFKKLVEKYFSDEKLGITHAQADVPVLHTLQNIERSFFSVSANAYQPIKTEFRSDFDLIRRNAYSRLLGMDLTFKNDKFQKPTIINSEFVNLFERYLTEIWRAHINATNTAGANNTDFYALIELAEDIRQEFEARRGGTNALGYINRNLSKEEYSSVLITSWLAVILSYDSPLVQFFSCESSSFGSRLAKLGDKVGVSVHSKSQDLFELALPAQHILLAIENGIPGEGANPLEDQVWLQQMLGYQGAVPTGVQTMYLNYFLQVINQWEKATGHNIKNTVRTPQNTVQMQQFINGSVLN